jgi:molybdopterin synthase sulfur carrier subunit
MMGLRHPPHRGVGFVRVRVRLGAGLGHAAAGGPLLVDLPEGADVGTLRRHLAERFPSLTRVLPRAVAVVGGTQAGDREPLGDGQDVAFLLPAAGG